MKTFSWKSPSQRIWIRWKQTQGEHWCYFQRRLGLCIWDTFSPHPMLCFCCTTCNSVFISLFVFIHWPHVAVRSTWQDLLQCHLMLLFIYRPHLLICSPYLGCLLFSSFSLWDWWGFSFKHSTCGMTEVTLEVLQGQSAINKSIYIYFNIYIKESCLCGFSLLTWGLSGGRCPPAPWGSRALTGVLDSLW